MQSDGNSDATTACVECSIRLPIRISSKPEAVRVRCRFCGSVYRGVLVGDAEDALRAHIEIMHADTSIVDDGEAGEDDRSSEPNAAD